METEYATAVPTSNTSRFNENVTHSVKRTIILTEYAGDAGKMAPFATLDTRNDIYRILGLVAISVKEIHTTVVNYNL